MIRAISSPSSSTTGLATLIFAINSSSHRAAPSAGRTRSCLKIKTAATRGKPKAPPEGRLGCRRDLAGGAHCGFIGPAEVVHSPGAQPGFTRITKTVAVVYQQFTVINKA